MLAQQQRSSRPPLQSPYEPFDPYEDEETQRRAQNQGTSALLAGILGSMLNRGQGMDTALLNAQQARQGVYDRSREDYRIRTQDERQRQQDEDEGRRLDLYEENIRADNARAEAAAKAKAEQDAAERAAKEAARQAEVEENRRLVDKVRKVDPTLADQLSELVESERFPVGEAVGATSPKPREAEKGRWDVDSQGRQVYFPPGGGAPQYKGYIDPERATESRRTKVEAEVERRFDNWARTGLTMMQRASGLKQEEISAKRAELRAEVEAEMGAASPPPTGTNDGNGKGGDYDLASDPGYTPAVAAAARAKGFDVAAARRDRVTWAEIRKFLGLM